MEPSGTLWPNGEFSIGYAACGGMERELTPSEYAKEWDAPLGLSLPSNSHSYEDTGKPRRGTKGLTSYGKKMLRNCAWRMQRLYGKRRLSFVTLTLPDLTYEEFWRLSTSWAEVCRVFYQKITRELSRLGLPKIYCGCTELQPARTERDEVPALHLHFIVVGRGPGKRAWALSPDDFRYRWKQVIEHYLGRIVDCRAVENVQMVKKDVSAYLSKYLSKGISLAAPPRSDETGWSLPTAWYNVSLSLRQWVKDNCRRHGQLMDMMERAARAGMLDGHCYYFFEGIIEEMTGPGPHYFVGKLKGQSMRELIEVWREAYLPGG